MKFKILFKCLSGLAISSSLFPVVMSLNRTHTHTQDSLSVGNLDQSKNDEVLADLIYQDSTWGETNYSWISYCTNKDKATKVVVPKYNPANNYEIIEGNSDLFINDNLIKTVEIKSSRFSFDSQMFNSCTGLESITFSNDVLTHFRAAVRSFLACFKLKNIYGLNMSLSNINDHVNIDGTSFVACPNINFHYTVQSGDDFTQVLHAYHSKFDNTGAQGYTFIESGDSFWDVIEDGIISPKANATFPSNLVIPKTITNKNGVTIKVKGIAENAFKDNNQIQSISFPATDNDNSFSIGNNAFTNCSNLRKITFASSNPDTFNIGDNVFVNCPNINNVEIQQDLDHISEGKTLIKKYKSKLEGTGVTTNPTYSTWWDSATNSPSETFNITNLNTQVDTAIGSGFKTWKDESPNTRSITIECQVTDNDFNGTAKFNEDFFKITTNITGHKEGVENLDITFTPILTLADSANNSEKIINLASGTIHLEHKPEPTPPSPETHTNIWAPLLGGVFGAIAFVGLTSSGIVFYKRKHNNK